MACCIPRLIAVCKPATLLADNDPPEVEPGYRGVFDSGPLLEPLLEGAVQLITPGEPGLLQAAGGAGAQGRTERVQRAPADAQDP